MNQIELKTTGYDSFISYMKGICILAVILAHACYIPGFEYTIGQQVPLFLLIQVFHCYKHGLDEVRPFNMRKTWNRILKPFLIVQLVILLISLFRGGFDIVGYAKGFLVMGGYGMGSYYPWVYLQFAILLPLVARMLRKKSLVIKGGVVLTLSIGVEMFCACIDINDRIWRLTCFRYLWLVFLGMVWVERGLEFNKWRLAGVLVSILFLTLFAFSDINLNPVFLTQTGWKNHHWICFFLVAFAIPPMLWWLRSHDGKMVNGIIETLGNYSWEIFLMQMLVFQYIHKERIMALCGDTPGIMLYVLIVFVMSIVPVLMYKKWSKQ